MTDTELEITVADDGAGVSQTLLSELTRRGVRIDENLAGSGLGLAIVKDLVGLYDGRLDFDRDPRMGGLRVRVRLPLAASS